MGKREKEGVSRDQDRGGGENRQGKRRGRGGLQERNNQLSIDMQKETEKEQRSRWMLQSHCTAYRNTATTVIHYIATYTVGFNQYCYNIVSVSGSLHTSEALEMPIDEYIFVNKMIKFRFFVKILHKILT